MNTTNQPIVLLNVGVVQNATWVWSETAVSEFAKIPLGTISHESHKLGMATGEPLILAMDALLKYAASYRRHYGSPLSDDGVLGEPWLDAAKGIRALLNGNGAIAMIRGRTTDSKDNGAVEGMFWAALEIAGYTEADI